MVPIHYHRMNVAHRAAAPPMPQTLMAFLAMSIAGLATLSQLSAQIETYDDMVHSEYQLMANALVIERMEIITLGTDYDDLDDLNGNQLSLDFTIDDFSVSFDLEITVEYSDDEGVPSEDDTGIRKVTIEATHDRYAYALVTHARLFSE